jgi:hypothetical protein
MKCRFACGNEARYIDEFGMFVCGTCPIKEGVDSIRVADVGPLLKLVREYTTYIDSISSRDFIEQARSLIGRKP